jgi:hypothetical protein
MPYDSSLDQKVFSKEWVTDRERLTVSVYSYNNGPRKLQITRENKDKEGNYRFTRLGRLSKEEIDAILPLIQEAVGAMES